jgi:CMP/dCMP kinase
MIIAIDGPAASGKGTLARRLADHFGYPMLETGLLYRAVGWRVLRAREDPSAAAAATLAARALSPDDLADLALRTDEAAAAASKVSAIPSVRQALLEFQRAFAHGPPGGAGGAVLDGRDIGTVVCPDADAKVFLTARIEVRAERRLKELRERGVKAIHSRVLQDMKERDGRDSGREVSPLQAAADALVLDTSDLDADQVFAAARVFIEQRCRNR